MIEKIKTLAKSFEDFKRETEEEVVIYGDLQNEILEIQIFDIKTFSELAKNKSIEYRVTDREGTELIWTTISVSNTTKVFKVNTREELKKLEELIF